MAKIISVKELRERLKYTDNTEVNNCLGIALDSATLYIEALLGTTLALKTDNEDLFVWKDYVDLLQKGASGSLFLRNGFVDSTGLVVELSSSMFDWTSPTSVVAGSYLLRNDKGLLYIDLEAITDMSFGIYGLRNNQPHIRVQYSSGFTEDVSGVFKDVPDWLQEAAVFVARELYRTDDDEVDIDGALGVMTILEHHIRKYALIVRYIS